RRGATGRPQQGATPFVFEKISPICEALNSISIVAIQKFSDPPQMHALMRITQPPQGTTQHPDRPERNEPQASRERFGSVARIARKQLIATCPAQRNSNVLARSA